MSYTRVKRGVIAVALLIVLAILPGFVRAFGISAPYLADDTLKVLPGNNYTYNLTIQNGETEEYYVDISYSSTKDVANLKETAYLVPANTYNNTATFNIIIPSKAKAGNKYILEYNAKPRTNETSVVSPNLEMLGRIKILVIEDSIINPNINKEGIWHKTSTYILIIVIIVLISLIIIRIWKLSRGLSSKLVNERVTTYTISQAINLREVQELLEKISDEEFRLPEIKNLFKEKISELTTHNLSKEIKEMSRKDAIRAIERIR